MKNKAIESIENRMQDLAPESYRYKVLAASRDFKSSWIALGQYLFSVYKDKMYKDWDYLTFEAYCAKEVGIRQATALKLLKSYSFLEKEEPAFLKREAMEERKPAKIPDLESVNALRLAKQSEKLTPTQYSNLRDEVLEEAKEEAEVKKKIRYIIKSSEPEDTEEDKVERKGAVVKRLYASLTHAKTDFQELAFPSKMIKQIDALMEMLEDYK